MIIQTHNDGSGARNPGFGSAMAMGKWIYGKLNNDFLHFLQIYGILDDFSKKHGVSSNMPKICQKNEERPCSICLLKTHFWADSGYPKIRFHVPDPSLHIKFFMILEKNRVYYVLNS